MRSNRAFTLIELLIVIGIIAVLTTILIPVITTSIADSHITVCATKLKTIVDSFAKFDDDTKYGGFARLDQYGADPDVCVTGSDGLALTTASLTTNAMQSVWKLIDAGFLPAAAFECPADGDYEPKTSPTKYGWDSNYQYSFGMQNPFDGDAPAGTVNEASPADEDYKSNQAFMADMNPGGAADNAANTYGGGQSNHRGRGCNVATRNGNVWFHKEESSSVVYGEEIYTDVGAIDSWPDAADDVVITPMDPKGLRDAE